MLQSSIVYNAGVGSTLMLQFLPLNRRRLDLRLALFLAIVAAGAIAGFATGSGEDSATRLVLAGVGDEHLEILSQIAILFSDEDDVATLPADFSRRLDALAGEIGLHLSAPRAETLREGFRVVIAGPPNAGKSTLFNALVESEAAITAPLAGTTRDVLTRPVALAGLPFLFADTAGLRDETGDAIEAIGIERARGELDRADLVLWLGPEGGGPAGAWEIEAQVDRAGHLPKRAPRHRLSAMRGEGMEGLGADLVALATRAMPMPGEAALNQRQHRLLAEAQALVSEAAGHSDPLLAAEALRQSRVAFDRLLGRTTTEDMLDALFGRFCIGK